MTPTSRRAGTFVYVNRSPYETQNLPFANGRRFLKLRNEPGAEMTVFGHGHHSCPGHLFASNEQKLLQAYLIIYYGWKLPDGQTKVQPTINGASQSPNSRQKLYESTHAQCIWEKILLKLIAW